MKIAVFDYRVTNTNAIGKCHLRVLAALCRQQDFTVFAAEFENPCPDRIHFARVPCVKRPLALLFVTFHLLAPLTYWWHRIRHRVRFDRVQFVESNLLFGDIAYAHFCHRAFLRDQWPGIQARGIRGIVRWLDHYLHAALEPFTYRRARCIVVPSYGLARELQREYPCATQKTILLPNPVDILKMQRPLDFDAEGVRRRLGFSKEDVVLAFVALGHYERKGLPLLLDALALHPNPRIKLLVVGGTPDLVSLYRRRVEGMGLSLNVIFVGAQEDVRSFLWCASALVLPSHYEVFPLVALEAAAAGLPLIVTPLNGVEEFLRDGENGVLVRERSAAALAADLARFAQLSAESRRQLGKAAQSDVRRYDIPAFISAWSQIYQGG